MSIITKEYYAILKEWDNLPNVFTGMELHNAIKKYSGCMDGTTTRQLRLLKQDRKLNYIVINPTKSIYKKLPLNYNDPQTEIKFI